MLKKFYPTEYYDSTYSIDFKEYYNKGYRAVIFDIDNTLVEHDAPADFRATVLIKKLLAMGYQVCFLSNNDEKRVADFNKELGAVYIYKAGKPLAKGYNKAMERMKTNKDNTLFVGDQLFTDIWGANNAKLHSILVKPIAKHEEIQIILKRIPEKLVLFFYMRKYSIKTKTNMD
ncbi:MAG: YqeG family HAD IIIA-type phosphatase [Lachnospiraceae bacterium]|nr:YqeG family HAD IIIA-type phosphatase [Lachnospiraceae bacterium]